MKRDTKLLYDQSYNSEMSELNETIRAEVGPDFPDFIAEDNLNNKIIRWKDIIQNKLTK
jgi:hypothetical protein